MSEEPQTPVIYPASGVYRPPLSITVSGSLSHGDKIYYITEDGGAEGSTTVKKRLYSEPFLLSRAGRVRVTAFVWRAGFGEGHSVSHIFLLDDNSKPSAPIAPPLPSKAHDVASQKRAPQRRVSFAKTPLEVQSLESFSVSIQLEDEAGFICSSTFDHPMKVVLSAETIGGSHTSLATVDLPSKNSTTKTFPPPFTQTSNILVSNQVDHKGNASSLGRSGKGGSWNAFADSSACLSGNQTTCSSVKFRVSSLCRAIVGLHSGLEDISSELSWRALPFSFHFSADLSDPSTVPAFRIYEGGRLLEDAGTEEFSVGDEFSIRVRPTGDVSYYHNGKIIWTSSSANDAVYSLHVRIAAQLGDVSIMAMSLVGDGEPFFASIDGLLWRPKTVPTGITENLVLRAWIAGTDVVPAVACIRLATNTIPRWAFAAINLASMFAIGSTGSQGGHVGSIMVESHARQETLQVVATPTLNRLPNVQHQ